MFSCYRYVILLRPIHTRDFAPGACSRGTLREQSSSVCTDDFMGIHHSWEQNFHPAKCSTIFNRLNIWEQAPGANWANLKTFPRVYWHVQNEPGACSRSKTPRVYRPLWTETQRGIQKGSRGRFQVLSWNKNKTRARIVFSRPRSLKERCTRSMEKPHIPASAKTMSEYWFHKTGTN